MDAAKPPENSPQEPVICPVCSGKVIDRMAREGLRDYLRYLIGRYPFRCRRCGHEFYLPQRGTQDPSS